MAVDNPKVALEVLDVLKRVTQEYDKQLKLLRGQSAVSESIRDGLQQAKAGGLADNLENVRDKLLDISKDAQKSGKTIDDSFKKAATEIIGAHKGLGSVAVTMRELWSVHGPKVALSFAGAFAVDTIVKFSKSLFNIGKSTTSLLAEIAAGAFDIGKAIWSIPTRIFQNLREDAYAYAQATLHIAQAWEDVRKQFGSFAEISSKSIKQTVVGMSRMRSGGLNLYNVFEDSGDAIKWMAQQAGALGATFNLMGSEIGKMGSRFLVFVKGMGLNEEAVRGFADRALSMGTTVEKQLTKAGKLALVMGSKFGISSKEVSQDIGYMTSEVGTFGNMTAEEMASSAVWMKKLGLEVKTLKGIVDKFLTFEDAATSASKLSQAFGVNLNTLKLMNGAARGGADTLDELRKSFFAAGRDASKMSVAELKLLSQNTGLSEAEARLAFSIKNRGKSLEQVRREGKAAGLIEKSQSEIMKGLADNVERFIRIIAPKESLFKQFVAGFEEGIKKTKAYTEVLRRLQQMTNIVHYAGMAVGRAFTEGFPGVKEFLGGLSEFAAPAKWKALMDKVRVQFTTFFQTLANPVRGGAAGAVQRLFDGIQDAFIKHTESTLGGRSAAMKGVKSFISNGIVTILTQAIDLVRGRLTEVFGILTTALTKGWDFKEVMGKLFPKNAAQQSGVASSIESFGTFMIEQLERVWHSVFNTDANNKLVEAAYGFLETAWVTINTKIQRFMFDHQLLPTSQFKDVFGDQGELKGTFEGTLNGFIDILKNWFDSHQETVSGLAHTIFEPVGEAIVSGIVEGAKNTLSTPFTVAGDFLTKISDDFSSIFETHSPSQVMAKKVGMPIGAGVIEGIKSALSMKFDLAKFMDDKIKSLGMLQDRVKKATTTTPTSILHGWQDTSKAVAAYVDGSVGTAASKVGTMLLDLEGNVTSVLGNLRGTFTEENGRSLLEAFATGMSEALGDKEGQEKTMLGQFIDMFDKVLEFFDISSPSKVFRDKVGGPIADGMVIGMESGLRDAHKRVNSALDVGGMTSMLTTSASQVGTSVAQSYAGALQDNVPSNFLAVAGLPVTPSDVDSVTRAIAEPMDLIQKLTADMEEIDRAFQAKPIVDVTARLREVGKSLGIKGDKLTIDAKPLEVTLNLNVVMESDKVAKVLLETSRIMPKPK